MSQSDYEKDSEQFATVRFVVTAIAPLGILVMVILALMLVLGGIVWCAAAAIYWMADWPFGRYPSTDTMFLIGFAVVTSLAYWSSFFRLNWDQEMEVERITNEYGMEMQRLYTRNAELFTAFQKAAGRLWRGDNANSSFDGVEIDYEGNVVEDDDAHSGVNEADDIVINMGGDDCSNDTESPDYVVSLRPEEEEETDSGGSTKWARKQWLAAHFGDGPAEALPAEEIPPGEAPPPDPERLPPA